MESLSTFSRVQVSRAQAASRPLPSPQTLKDGFLEGFRQRNSFLDFVFYDVKVIDDEEAVAVAPHLAAEGAVLIVPPSGAGKLVLCPTIESFAGAGGADVKTLAIAGVGSSALGSAAFARNVADATGAPVAAVVSGYGLSDLLTEALGGYFWFGTLNSLRHSFELWDEAFSSRLDKLPVDRSAGDGASVGAGAALPRLSRDTATVVSLLTDERFAFSLATGHSKGNLVLSEALYLLLNSHRARLDQLAQTMRLVTVSARIAMPPVFPAVTDVMGAIDWFGGLNSRPDIKADVSVPFAWHHTNTDLPMHLPVTKTFAQLIS